MSFWVEVQGVVLPAKLAGHQALEFCNTWAGWNGGESGDFLKSYEHLAIWTGWQGLLDARTVASLRRRARANGAAARAEMVRARRFRASLYRVLAGEPTTRSWRAVASDIERAAEGSHLVARPDSQGPLATWKVDGGVDLEAPRLAVAAVAGDLLTSTIARQVRSCPGEGCGWLFLDPSGRRRWCSMATCGNRAKARRFAERHRRAASAGRSRSTGLTSSSGRGRSDRAGGSRS
jgi:predicted RNA-binding Zn ribbon-like protein